MNLKYVQYNKTTGTLTDVLSAPPPGLFSNNPTTWPTWTPSTTSPGDDAESTINLSTIFPTTSIFEAVKKTFGFTTTTITKKEWFEKTNSNAFTLDLSSLFISSIAELFNPNLVWGFGIYDLHTQVINTLMGTKKPDAANEILYNGLYKIIANDNALDYFPNPQFNNMPALRYIQATNNKIKAVGDFASYENGDLNAKNITTGSTPSYFLYLQSLWDSESTKNYPAIMAIKKWLTTTLPGLTRFANSTGGSTSRGTISDQLSFQIAISANNIYFPDKSGDVLKTGPSGSPIPSGDGSWGDLNFASVVLNVSKNFYEIDFSLNQIQRLHVTPTKFTYINLRSNQLKYVPPLALEPLPWNYLATAVQAAEGRNPIGPRKSGSTSVNTTQWNTNYNQNNSKSTSFVAKENSFPITQKLIAPTLQFSNNQILDFWPNNTKADDAPNDGWYTWPNTTTGVVVGEPPVASSLASTRAAAPSPYNRSTYSAGNYSAYLHRNFLTARPEGGEYNQSSANLLGDWKNSGFTDKDDANFYRYYFASLDDNVELISQQNFTTQLNFNLFGNETSKQKPFVLPGYETSGSKMNTSIATFNQGLKLSSSTNETVDRYYDNLVPYLLGRTLPQNRTTAETWSSKNLQVKLTGDDGRNLLSSFTTLNSATVFNALNNGSFTATDNATNFVKQILGALPYGNGTYDNKVTGDTNVATGIPKDTFASQSRVTLSIQQPDLGFSYNYVINVLKNLNYAAEAKNPKGSDKKTEDIVASSFTKKTSFALATAINATDLLNETGAWLNASDYVKIYLENNPGALTITNYDIAKGEITVRFNINDVNGAPVSLTGLDNNTMVLTGFTSLNSSFVNDSGTAIMPGENDELDKLTNHFLPKDVDEVRTWIKDHYQVNWLGLDLKDGGTTAGVSAEHPNGYYKLSELKNDYITNLNVQANSGALSFTVIIPATAANDNVPLSRSHNLTSFLKFGMNINTSSYDKTSKQAVYDYQQKPELLKKFVELAPTRTLNSGTQATTTPVKWWKDDEGTAQTDKALQDGNLIPKYATLTATVNASSDLSAGILNFDVSLLDNSNPTSMPLPVISTQSKTLTGLYNYSSEFSLNGTSTIGSTGVRYISDATKSTSTTSQLNDVLKGYATTSNQDGFRTWIEPLIDFSKSDQTYNVPTGSTTGNWTPSALSAEQKAKLVYGFGTNVTLTANDITTNVGFDADSNTLSINNLHVKGGYLNGHFYDGSDASAPVTALSNSVYSFFGQTTQNFDIGSFNSGTSTIASEKWNGKTYQGANAYFQDAVTKWKTLLPSEWAARLLSLKNANRENTVSATTYQVQNYDTLFSFLNHVVNTSTSNLLYKTRVDINDVSKIEVNDFAGLITIPANTLLIYNNYGSDTTSSPDALNAQPKTYGTAIKLQLSDYKTRLSDEVKNALPWKLEPAVNAQFQAVDANVVQRNLNQLLAAAKKLYSSSDALSNNEQRAALTAIQILASNFIADEYYTQPNANVFFTHKFGSLGPSAQANEYTQFESIAYSDVDTLNGTMKVTVTLKNYISGYDTSSSKYTLENKTKEFTLTNLLRQFATPIWNNDDSQTTTPQIMNLATTAPELRLFQPGTDNPIFSYQTVSRTAFNNQTAEAYYNELIASSANQLGDYIKIGPEGFKFANWSIVNNYGISPEVVDASQLKALTDKLAHAKIVIKKSDIRFSARTNQIYLINPVIHFTGTYDNLAAKQTAMANIFDPLRNSPNHVPFGVDQNFQTNSLTNITLTGFAKVPTQISLKTNVTKIQLGEQTFNQNEVLPSQIYDWIQNNYSNSTQLYNLFMSFYNLTGTSDLKNPLTISLNPAIIAVLNQVNGSKDISSWISFNDGYGTISFKDVFFISNTFSDKNQKEPTSTISPITHFMSANSHDQFSLNDLQKSSFKSVEANQAVKSQISSNIATAMNELEQNNFSLAHKLLMVNEIKTNLINDESQLEINKVTSNLQSGELLIHYTVRNTYANGQKTNMSGVYVLSNFHSPIVSFLQAGLAPLLIGFAALVLGVYFINRRYRNNMNTRKYTKKKKTKKKG